MKKTVVSMIAAVVTVTAADYVLDPIEVTAVSKTAQHISDVTSSVSVVTAEELEALHIQSLTEVLNRLPGIAMTQNGGPGTTQNVLIRGMSNERVLVLIDGVRFQDPSSTSGTSFTNLLVSEIERIEVVRGAQSGIWGSDAAAGVINIVTKKAASGTHATVTLEAGSYQTKKASALLTHQSGKNSLKLSVSRFLSDGFTAQAPYGEDIDRYEDDGYQNTTLSLSARHAFSDNTSMEVRYHDINSFTNFDAYNAPDSLQRADYRSKLFSTAVDHQYDMHALRMQYDHTTFERNDFDTLFGVKLFEGKNRNIELRDRIDYIANGFLNIGVQKEYFDADYTNASLTQGHLQTDTTACYATNSNRFENLVFTQALRYDDYSNFDRKVTGRAGLKYLVNEELSVTANYGTAYNAPSIIKILNPWGVSNPGLEPEMTRGGDLGIAFGAAEVTFFYNKVDNLITWSGGGYVNGTGKSTFRGVEAAYSREFGDRVVLTANYTYTDARNGQDQVLKQRPKHQLMANTDYYVNEALHIGLSAEHIGTRYNSDNEQGRQTGRYTLWNMVANYDLNEQLRGYAKITNLTDKYYQTVDGYATAERSFYVGLTAEF